MRCKICDFSEDIPYSNLQCHPTNEDESRWNRVIIDKRTRGDPICLSCLESSVDALMEFGLDEEEVIDEQTDSNHSLSELQGEGDGQEGEQPNSLRRP